MSFDNVEWARQIGWRLKPRLKGRAALRHEVRLRRLPGTLPTGCPVGARLQPAQASSCGAAHRRGFSR